MKGTVSTLADPSLTLAPLRGGEGTGSDSAVHALPGEINHGTACKVRKVSFPHPKKWAPYLVAIPLGLAVLAFPVFFKRYKIPQGGMFPTYAAGAHFVARRSPYASVADVRRGDIVIYTQMRDGERYDFVWRVVGLPGEKIAIHADTVLVDGRALPHRQLRTEEGFTIFEETADGRSYQIALPSKPDDKSELAEIEVPPDHVFVLGDNRHNAYDSRGTGPVPFDAIVARVTW